jgi:hypothetical protein
VATFFFQSFCQPLFILFYLLGLAAARSIFLPQIGKMEENCNKQFSSFFFILLGKIILKNDESKYNWTLLLDIAMLCSYDKLYTQNPLESMTDW